MKYNLREMTVEDIEAVIEGETKAFGTSLGYDLIYTDLTFNPYAHYMVLEIDKEIHGYIGLWINDNSEIINFYVDEEYRGLGFGKMMLDFAIKLCELSKVNNLSLEVRESNQVARNLYEKHGFKFSHKRERYYDNGEDALVLIKSFGEERWLF